MPRPNYLLVYQFWGSLSKINLRTCLSNELDLTKILRLENLIPLNLMLPTLRGK